MIYKKPKTEEKIKTQRLNPIVSLSLKVSKVKVNSSAKIKMQGQSKVLEMEISFINHLVRYMHLKRAPF